MDDLILQRFNSVRNDPWEFAKCVRTQDQTDIKNPIKAFPSDLQYLKLYARLWQREKKVAVPKSRRMFMTWMNLILYLWDTAFHIGRLNAIVSKKEEDSANLIEKCKFILDNLDPNILPKALIPKYTHKYGVIDFPEINSRLQGFPSGPAQMRQYTFSGIMADELSFWPDAEESYASSLPTLEGGGRFTAVSSPAPGFFKKLIFDQLDVVQDDAIEMHGINKLNPIEGVEIWKNPKNKFAIFQTHYTANPNKRDPKYQSNLRASMPRRQYEQEYNLAWDSWLGAPVYPDFSVAEHGAKIPIEPVPGLPLLISFDFGLTPAAVVAQLQEDTLVVLREFTEVNMGAQRFTERLVKQLRQYYPNWHDLKKHWHCFIDPAGQNRDQSDEGTCALVLDSFGFKPVPGPIGWEERRQAVEHFLFRRTKKGPTFKINLSYCPILVKGFQGGYRYQDSALEIEPNKVRPIKDETSHPHDALQYLCGRVRMIIKRDKVNIPVVTYKARR